VSAIGRRRAIRNRIRDLRPLLALFFSIIIAPVLGAFPLEGLDVRLGGRGILPVFDSAELFGAGFGYGAGFGLALPGPFGVSVNYAELSLPVDGASLLGVSEGSLAATATFMPSGSFFLRFGGGLGLYSARYVDAIANGVSYNAQAEIGWRISPAATLWAEVGASRLQARSGVLLDSARAGAYLSLRPAGLDRADVRLRVDSIRMDQVFPVFYSFYDDNPFGKIVLRNDEASTITDLSVTFLAPAYMSRAKTCISVPSLAPGESVTVPVKALFDESMLSLTESSLTKSEIRAEYRLIGAERELVVPVTLSLQHRNAMTWSDDRRAAAFVSAQDPAVLWFSRYVGGIIRDRMRSGMDANLQNAVGLFEALRLFGIAYVVDPSSSYVALSGDEETIDYLQFPYQTLSYRGGDCDDLSILFASLLQSLGIESAFVTIPGHIYVAFALQGDPTEAVSSVYDRDLFFVKDGKAWVPLEITMIKDGFVKAWRVGAKEWRDNDLRGEAKFYPMTANWKAYKAVGVANVNPRFLLPDEAETMRAFDQSLDRYAVREIEVEIAALATSSPGVDRPPATALNEAGIAYARYGMLKEAWSKFGESAKENFAPAWINLAHIAFLRKDFELGIQYYQWSLSLAPDNAESVLGIARCQYELERFSEATESYEKLRALDPALAGKYGYLASIFGGVGRAWSLSERAASVRWLSVIPPRSAQTSPADVGAIENPSREAVEVKRTVEPERPAPDTARIEAERAEAARAEAARAEAERAAAARAEAARIEAERAEAARIEAERIEVARIEAARVENERAEAARREAERAEAARIVAARIEAERLEAARIEAARAEAERVEAARVEDARAEAARIQAEQAEAARAEAAAKAEVARIAAENAEADKAEAARAEAAHAEAARLEAAARAEAARLEAERVNAARLEAAARAEAARLEAVRAEAARLEAARVEAVRAEAARAEAARVEAVRAEAARLEAARAEAARIEAARVEAARLEAARAEAARIEAARLEAAARAEAARAEAARAEAARVEAARAAAAKAVSVPAAPVISFTAPEDRDILEKTVQPPASVQPPAAAKPLLEAAPVNAAARPPVIGTAPIDRDIQEKTVAREAEKPAIIVPKTEVVPVPVIVVEKPAVVEKAPEPVETVEEAVAEEPEVSAEEPAEPTEEPLDGRLETPPTVAVAEEPLVEVAEPLPTIENVAPIEETVAIPEAEAVPVETIPEAIEQVQVAVEPGKKAETVSIEPVIVEPVSVEPVPVEPEIVEPAIVEPVRIEPQVPDFQEILSGFASFKGEFGAWSMKGNAASQTDTKQLFAKLIAKATAESWMVRYRFSAQATGRDWVGFGLHLLVEGEPNPRGYGYGSSFLVWFTHDEKTYGEAATRVQAYRSYGTSDLRLVYDAPLGTDLFSRHDYRIEYEASGGTVTAFVDGAEALRFVAGKNLPTNGPIAIRALDAIDFFDFFAETEYSEKLGREK